MRGETSIRPPDDEESIDWAVALLRDANTKSSMGARISSQLGSRNSLAFLIQKFPGAIQIAVCDERRIGLVGLSDIDVYNKKANIWFTRNLNDLPPVGSMSDAVTLLCSSVKASLELKTVFAWAAASNRRSHSLLERAGFQRFGIEPLGFYDGREFMDVVWFNRVLL